MLPKDFNSTFNEAIKSEDWMLVTILGEQAIAEKSAVPDILYNLSLAYLKLDKPSMSTAALLAIPRGKRDLKTTEALSASLQRSGSSPDDLSLGAQGIKGSLIDLSESVPASFMQSACGVSLGLLIVVLIVFFFGVLNRYKKILKIVAVMGSIVAAVSGLSLVLKFSYQGHWGAVISSDGAPLRKLPSEESEVTAQLSMGKPILIVGETRGPWIRVWDADGNDGWAPSLAIRVISQ